MPARLATLSVLAAGTAGLGVVAWTYLRITRTARSTAPGNADAILVLGARAVDDRPTAELRARLDHAVTLWHAGRAPEVLCSGSAHEQSVMAAYLSAAGVPAGAVRSIPGSTTRRSLGSASGTGLTTVLAVTSPYHVHRVVTEARRHGLVAIPAPAPHSPEQATPGIRRLRTGTEVAASAWYALPDAVTARVPTGPGTLRHTVPRRVVLRLRRRHAHTHTPTHTHVTAPPGSVRR